MNYGILLKKFLAHVDDNSSEDFIPSTISSGFSKEQIEVLFILRDEIAEDKEVEALRNKRDIKNVQ
jgi:hypothetical protein